MSEHALRFGGTARIYGQQQLQTLANASVCVIGIGGVGSWVAEALARSAIGKLTLIDLDDVCLTNTNRQIHALTDTVGTAKVDAMASRIKAINPECLVTAVQDFVTAKNVAEHLTTGFDYVVDATDSVKAKAAIIAHCKRHKIPALTVGGAGGQTDPTQIAVTDLTRTIQDPLAAKVRSELRRFYGFSDNKKRRFGIDCVYSNEQLKYPQADGSVSTKKHLKDGSTKLDCNFGFGAAVAVTATFGFVAAARVIDKILSKAARKQA
ncbi:tRNA cyclic N6-threonylcarbamoyladenosine(37) synthase TcdA [Aestuariibacter salexigens]|uniref:tRNA cyclic N6-threonylcarbamoyladenosine(37) synthase TcdA n=1 Tax=Aestuariibacter salexigens TaxID=226010 RepID=UPI00040A5E20|nr:tRNA cyclic N6-threonylcarbamoyladenosine(37) synthase TcdA [Aestuariibacter salexigens]